MNNFSKSSSKTVFIIANDISFHLNFSLNSIEVLLAKDYKIFLIANVNSVNVSKTKLNTFTKLMDESDVSILHVDIPRNPFRILLLAKALIVINKMIRMYKPTLIHGHTPAGGILARITGLINNVRVFYTAHGFHFFSGSNLFSWVFYFPLEVLLGFFTEKIITINNEDYELFSKIFKKKTLLINGIGINPKDYLKKNNPLKKHIIFVSVGELNKNKNHKAIIKSLSSLDFDYEYWILGRGRLSNYLEKLSFKQRNRNRVKFYGYQDDVFLYLSKADVFIIPSKREGLPVSLLQAMSVGLPVLGSDIRGINDLINVGIGGYLFNPNKIKSIVYTINKLIENRILWGEMGHNNFIKSKFYSTEQILIKLQSLYD